MSTGPVLDSSGVMGALLDGSWRASESGRTLEVRSPIDNSLVGRTQALTQEEVDASVTRAAKAQRAWAHMPLTKRHDVLLEAAALLREQVATIGDTLVMEIGKPKKEARSEVSRTADLIEYTVETSLRLEGELLFGDRFPGASRDKIAMVYREPIGVVLAIGPFNYPVNLSASKIAPALVMGNSVVFKPPHQGSISALRMAECFRAAGVPPGVLEVATGRGSEIGDFLTRHPRVGQISFTGSSETGHRIAKSSGMVSLLKELGGKDPALVLDDADLELAEKEIVAGAFSYSGQRCTAVKRVLTLPQHADALVDRIAARAAKLKVGDPREDDVEIGPVIDDASADFISGLVEDALMKGAKAVLGPRREGRLLWPTVIDHVTEDMRLAWEEPFGPVLPILRVPNVAEAIRVANASQYGLQASVFTRDIDRAISIAREIEAGTVHINGRTARGPDHFPFTGAKDSGIGTQGARYALENVTRLKSIVLNVRERLD